MYPLPPQVLNPPGDKNTTIKTTLWVGNMYEFLKAKLSWRSAELKNWMAAEMRWNKKVSRLK